MCEDGAAPATPEQRSNLDGIKRLDLLSRHFSEEEILRLSALQQSRGARPDALDRSIQEGRLQFVRWLVQHGRLGEGIEVEAEKPSREEPPAPGIKWLQERFPGASGTATARGPAGASDGSPNGAHILDPPAEQQPDDGRSPLRCVWARIRQGLARAAGIGSRLASWIFLPPERSEIDPYSLRNPDGTPWTYIDDPWPWTHFRNGW